jgi:PleD family two-component response regulator
MAEPTLFPVRTKVLFIDGNDRDRAYFGERLAAEHVVIYAANGQNGLDCFFSICIDCVILEIDLPDMSGFEVLVKLVPIARRPIVPVIVLTRLTNNMLLDLALDNGAQAAFRKSHTSGDVLGLAVRRVIAAFARSETEET